jgi:flagellar biogenesis protein FliO
MMDLYVQMATALAGVVGLIFIMAFFLRKRQSKPGIMSVVSYQSLGPKKAIVALSIGKEILLLGVTQADLKLLKTYDKNEFEAEPIREMSDKLVRLKNIKADLYESK